ncbi:MAG: hypothetical protein IPN29_02860 [Saprospiraceae bacterium]|nr:hypothetical protein [Saprospiraceae bacterium]
MPITISSNEKCLLGKYGVILILSLFQLSLQSQVWTPVSGLPIPAALKTVKFIDSSIGWVAGENGAIYLLK